MTCVFGRVWIWMCRTLISASIIGLCLNCAHTSSSSSGPRARTLYELGWSTFQVGNTRGALKELRGAIELDPDYAAAHNLLGLVYHVLGEMLLSQEHYQRALELQEPFSEAANNLGTLFVDMGRYDEAIQYFQLALGNLMYPTPYLALGNMGWAYYRRGNVEKGVRYIRDAVARNQRFCRGYHWLLRIGLEAGKTADFVREYALLEKHCLSDIALLKEVSPRALQEVQYHYALVMLKEGHPGKARKALATCQQLGDLTPMGEKCEEAAAMLPTAIVPGIDSAIRESEIELR